MAKMNAPALSEKTRAQTLESRTHEGAPGISFSPEMELRRTIACCLLWEDTFYEDGKSLASRIEQLVSKSDKDQVQKLAVEARTRMKLRHAPLYLVKELAKYKPEGLKDTVAEVIQRPDELAEVLAMFGKPGQLKDNLTHALRKGIAKAFTKFDEYQLSKYNRDNAIKLKDVLFLTHPKPESEAQAKMWKRLIDDKLKTPDTWEVAISACKTSAEKKKEWERLLADNKLGALALLRNLRNMEQAGVKPALIFGALEKMNLSRVLPMRFITAAKHAPQWEDKLEAVLYKAVADRPKIKGHTVLLVDVSGSMSGGGISGKSELMPADVAAALAILVRELCENVTVAVFGDTWKVLPARRGFALRDAIRNTNVGSCTNLMQSVKELHAKFPDADRIITIGDEQSHDTGTWPFKKNYTICVGQYKNSVGYGKNVVRVAGWSESVLDFIEEFEKLNAPTKIVKRKAGRPKKSK